MDTIITWMGDRLLGWITKQTDLVAEGNHWINSCDLFNNFIY